MTRIGTRLIVAFAMLCAVRTAGAAPTTCGNGILDKGEQCDAGAANGTSTSCCKKDCHFLEKNKPCRPAAGGCDVADVCSGTTAICPETLRPAGMPCRPVAGACDVAEQCDGVSTACPADARAPEGAPCDDGNACTFGDTCHAGACIAGTPGCAGDVLTFSPAEDSWVDSALPTANYDTDSRLRIDASPARIGYLRFRVAGTAGRKVQQARLRLEASSGSATSGGAVHLLPASQWSASTLTWANRPPVGTPAVDRLGAVATGAIAEFRLDGAIRGDGTYDVAVDSDTSDGIAYRSTAATSGRRPELVLTVEAAGSPKVTIEEPADEAIFVLGDPVALRARAIDDTEGDVSDRIQWSSDVDGAVGTGAALVVTALSEGTHTLTAAASDSHGATGRATVRVMIVSRLASLVFSPVADTYVDADLPGSGFGSATELKADASPVREALLRFVVSGVHAPIEQARLRLTVTSSSTSASDSGGILYSTVDLSWSEATTFANRPAIDGSPLASAGAVGPNAVVDFDVTGTVSGDGTYGFVLGSASSDGTAYRSREASAGRPELIVSLQAAGNDQPVVTIASPSRGTRALLGQPILFSGAAADAQDGDLGAALRWDSSLDGVLGTGATFTRLLHPGTHTITASATDHDLHTTTADTTVTVETTDAGFADQTYGSAIETNDSRATGEKPESKLWYNAGGWWASLFSSSASAYRIHRLDPVAQTWVDTGVAIDERPRSRQDALWDGQKLYILSRFSGLPAQPGVPAQPAENRLLRYAYANGVYTLDHGFPVQVPGGGTESATIAKDSTGKLWTAYTLGSRVLVSQGGSDGKGWSAPIVIPVAEGTTVSPDDIAAVVALPGEIGVFWSNQVTKTFYLAVHGDGRNPNDASAWRLEIAAQGPGVADDHLNLKVASDGRLFVAVKTSHTAPGATLVGLLVRSPTGTWSSLYDVTKVEYDPTRPQLLLDEVSRRLWVFYSAFDAAIYYKTSDMDVPAFPDGIGTPLISSSTLTGLNNPTTTKQRVDASSGIVVLGSTPATHAYWHNVIAP